MAALGYRCLMWDIILGPAYDLTLPKNRHLILGWISSGSIYIWGRLATPSVGPGIQVLGLLGYEVTSTFLGFQI